MEDWYERRNELEPGQVFRTCWDRVVQLDYRVPGDATQWRVLSFSNGRWFADDDTIEPSDLEERLPDDYSGDLPTP